MVDQKSQHAEIAEKSCDQIMRDKMISLIRKAGYQKDVRNSDGEVVTSYVVHCIEEEVVEDFVDFLIENHIRIHDPIPEKQTGIVIRFDNGTYWCGNNKISSDIRDAQIYRTEKNAHSSAKWEIDKRDGLKKRAQINDYELFRISIDINEKITQSKEIK